MISRRCARSLVATSGGALDEQKPLPDLVVIDGGKGQLGAAADALRELGLETRQLISLAKREEEIYVLGPGGADPAVAPLAGSAACCSRPATRRTASP